MISIYLVPSTCIRVCTQMPVPGVTKNLRFDTRAPESIYCIPLNAPLADVNILVLTMPLTEIRPSCVYLFRRGYKGSAPRAADAARYARARKNATKT